MPTLSQMRWFSTTRFNRIIGRLAAQLEIQRPLVYLDRLPLVPAFNDELTGRFTGKILAADLIADDQEAVVQNYMTLDVVSHTAPNIKHGQRLGQRMLDRLDMLSKIGNVAGENALRDWDTNIALNLLLGVRWRMNALACAMMIDSFAYDRLGVKIAGGTWGMPSNLKVTVGVAWSTAATATPIADILGIDQVARLNYGIEYDTVTMSTADFRNMVATTEFANKATLVVGTTAFLLTPAALRTKADPQMQQLAQQVLGKTIVLDDQVYNTRNNAGTIASTRALPTGTVLLSRRQDQGDPTVMDMANGVPTESIVAGMVRTDTGLAGGQYGPIGYWTRRDDLNPPDIVAWAVSKSFPRKFVPEATAVLNGV